MIYQGASLLIVEQ
jgi:hypothetical protein